tara:strand:+ start:9898 stop:10233 length:336 start_codon:yes stop_codon:yes gene_type:complete
MAKKNQVITCGNKWKCKCEHHNLRCIIPIEFPQGDSRLAFVAELQRLGADKHDKESDHRCDLCESERQEGRRAGYYQKDPRDGKVKPKLVVDKLEKEREDKRKYKQSRRDS